MPERIQRRRTVGWRMPKGAVYVGRPTRWGNPYAVAPDAPEIVLHDDGRWWTVRSDARSFVVGEFRADLATGLLPRVSVQEVRDNLAGLDLVCSDEAQHRHKHWQLYDGEPLRHRVHAQGETPPMPFPDVILAHLNPPTRETA